MPALSVIVPAHDAAATLGACLDALVAQAGAHGEVIVVDNGSQDDTATVAARYPVTLLRSDVALGAGGARNAGAAAARAPILLFVDADVVLGPGAVDRVRATFEDPAIDGVFGSYDDTPAARSLVSQWKNLSHHYFHQRGSRRAATWFGGCGALRRSAFDAAGGFDAARYPLASIEDIDLGQRLVHGGAAIVLDHGLQGKHLKRWTLVSVLATDVRRRAIPWTELILERWSWPRDLNLAVDQLAAALLVAAAVAALPFAGTPWGLVSLAVIIAGMAIANRDLFRLLLRRGGIRLAVAGFLLQQLYYVYAAVGFAAGVAVFAWRRLGRRRLNARVPLEDA